MRRVFHAQKFLTFIKITSPTGKEVQYNIIPQRIAFTDQKWVLTCKEVPTRRIMKIPMTKISQWTEIINEDIDTPGRVY